MKVDISEEKWLPRDINVEIIDWRCELAKTGGYLDEDDPPFHRRTVVHARMVCLHPQVVMTMSFCQMSKRMKNILRDHANGLVLFKEFPFSTGVSNHPLHHIINRDEVGKKTMASALFNRFQLTTKRRGSGERLSVSRILQLEMKQRC